MALFVPKANIQVLNVNSDRRQLEVLKFSACWATIQLNTGHWDIACQGNKVARTLCLKMIWEVRRKD